MVNHHEISNIPLQTFKMLACLQSINTFVTGCHYPAVAEVILNKSDYAEPGEKHHQIVSF